MPIVRQVSVFLENQPGRFAALADLVADEGVNVEGVMLPSGTDFGIVHLVVDDDATVLRILEQHGYRSYTSHLLDVRLRDHPGALAELTGRLSEAGIDINYGYSAIAPSGARLVLAVSDVERADELLGKV